MKLSVIALLLITALLLLCRSAHAQVTKQINDSLFQEVKKQVNAQNGAAIYALLNDDFKAKMTQSVFIGALTNNLYPLGSIQETSLIAYTDGTSKYKAVCANAVIQFNIAADKDGKIAGLRFLPYKEPVANKNYIVPTSNPLHTRLDKRIDTIARQYIDKVTTVGMSIGILQNGVTTMYGYGTTDKARTTIPGADAVFELGSITKTFTATLLAYYAGEHKVSLSDPITKYLPDSVAANKDLAYITLEMLANHTSGLPRLPGNLFDNSTDMANPYKSYDQHKLYACLKTCKPESKPGEKYAYSNLGAGLLANILERVSGKSYEQMIKTIICGPLAMGNTYQHPGAQQQEQQVNVYNDKAEPVMMWDMDALSGAGALRSTTCDMLLYAAANMQKSKTPLAEAMQLTHHITYSKDMSIGLGWHKTEITGTACYWHNGGTGGSSSYIGFMPDRNIAVVVFSNSVESVDVTAQSILKILQ